MTTREPLLTSQQAADQLNVSYGGLAQMRFKGTGPAFVKLGRAVRYRQAAIDDWVASSERTRT